MRSRRGELLAWAAGLAAASIVGIWALRTAPLRGTPPAPSMSATASAAPLGSAEVDASDASIASDASSETTALASTAAPEEASKPAPCPKEPKIEPRAAVALSGEELLRAAKDDPRSLGSASIGAPTRGSLWGGVEMKGSEDIERAGGYGWGTESVVRSIERAAREVRRCYPGGPRLQVGDIARERGGWLRPHASHQSGLDADLGYYYRGGSFWYLRATRENLDVARTWALVRALLDGGNVEMIFMDLSVQRVVRDYLKTLPAEEQPPDDLFASPLKRDAIIRHAWGHATHFHVRFVDPAAAALGERIRPLLPRLVKPKRGAKP